MKFNRVEKITFTTLSITFFIFLIILIINISKTNESNKCILSIINEVSKNTDKTPLEKTFYFDEKESFNKLNLNKTNLESIKTIPCLSAPLAKRIYEYIKDR